MGDAIRIVEYDPSWPRQFAAAQARIAAALGALLLGLEHMGSTAVPGLAAKPVIDILIGVRGWHEADGSIAPLEALGYTFIHPPSLPARHFLLLRDATGAHFHHLHLTEYGGRFWRKHLLFRDELRARLELRRAYAALKYELAARHGGDREAYTDAKTGFVMSVLASAGWHEG